MKLHAETPSNRARFSIVAGSALLAFALLRHKRSRQEADPAAAKSADAPIQAAPVDEDQVGGPKATSEDPDAEWNESVPQPWSPGWELFSGTGIVLLGLVVYLWLRLVLGLYYMPLRATPEEVGLNYSTTLSSIVLLSFGVLIYVGISRLGFWTLIPVALGVVVLFGPTTVLLATLYSIGLAGRPGSNKSVRLELQRIPRYRWVVSAMGLAVFVVAFYTMSKGLLLSALFVLPIGVILQCMLLGLLFSNGRWTYSFCGYVDGLWSATVKDGGSIKRIRLVFKGAVLDWIKWLNAALGLQFRALGVFLFAALIVGGPVLAYYEGIETASGRTYYAPQPARTFLGPLLVLPFHAEPSKIRWISDKASAPATGPPQPARPTAQGLPFPTEQCVLYLGQSGSVTVVYEVLASRSYRLPSESIAVETSAEINAECSGNPDILSIQPSTGPLTGGQEIVIKGTRLFHTIAVRFYVHDSSVVGRELTAVRFRATSDEEVRVVTPKSEEGIADVVVETRFGVSTSEKAYRYVAG